MLLAALAIAVLVAACGDSEKETSQGDTGKQEKVRLCFCATGGSAQQAMNQAWIEPFMAAHPNIEIINDEPADISKAKAMVEAKQVTWDVVFLGNDSGIGENEQWFMKLDPKIVPLDELQPELFATTGRRVPGFVYATLIGYRTDKFGDKKPTSLADFFDLEKFPGKRGTYTWPAHGLLEMALIADGVAPDQLYPLDVERAFKKIDTIKDQIVWWTAGAQSEQLLADGEVVMCTMWNGRLENIRKAGAPVAPVWEQFFPMAEYLMIPEGTKHPKEAMELVAWITSAEHNADYSKYITYAPANANAVQKVGPTVAEKLPSSHMDGAVAFNDVWWAENMFAGENVYDQWQKWIRQ